MFVMFAREKTLEKKISAGAAAAFKCSGVSARGISAKLSENGEIVFVGEFGIGELGVFKGENVELEIVKTDLGEALSDEEACAKATEFLKAKQAEIAANGKSLCDYFLVMMLLEARESGNEFWQSYKSSGSRLSDEECVEIFDSFTENDIDIDGILKKYDKYGLKTTDTNVYELISEKLGFFDVNKLLKNMVLECMHISLTEISMQLSDKYNEIFVGAYENFDDRLVPQDWHNF